MNITDLTEWLLAAETPSIRYLTLRDLLGYPETDPQSVATRREIMAKGAVPAILAGQTVEGHWSGESSYYSPKYTSTHWSMQLLAELAAEGEDPRLQRGAEYMLTVTENRVTQALQRETRSVFPCFWGNLLRYALHCGRANDPRVGNTVRYLAQDAQMASWRCRHNAELPCAWGAARVLWGLATLPSVYRTSEVEGVIESALVFLLEDHQLTQADYPTSGRIHPLWFRLNFPLFYQVDILFVLRVLGELDALDHPGARPALEWLAARRGANGRWRGACPYKRRTWEGVAGGEETDRWVSLQAAVALKRMGLG